MSKLRIFYISSLVILGVLLVFTVLRPMTSGEKYSLVSRESTIQTEDQWIIEFDIVNHEGEDQNYTINVSVDGKPSTITVSIPDGKAFTYIKHVYPHMFSSEKGQVNLTVYKEGEATPFEQATYYIRFD